MRSDDLDLDWLCREHPGLIDGLCEDVDPQHPDLAGNAGASEDRREQVANLLARIAAGNCGHWLRGAEAPEADWALDDVDRLLENTFTIQDVAATQPCPSGKGLDWHDRGPHHDREWAWLLNRHAWAPRLVAAWRERSDERYARHCDSLLADWLVQNPRPLGHCSSGPWRELEVGLRLAMAWPQVFYALQRCSAFRPLTRVMMLASVRDHCRYLLRYHRRRSNHASMEMNGLLLAATAFPFFREADAWRDHALAVLSDEAAFQVYPDGVQIELTAMYHWVSLRHFDQAIATCQAAGLAAPTGLVRPVAAMWDYLAGCLRPDGSIPLNNDGDRVDFREQLRQAAEQHGREDWRWSEGVGRSTPADPPSRAYPWAGQLIMRSGWDREAQWAFFDLGPWGWSHQHDDHLHLSLHAHGRDLLVDSGRFAYTGDLFRYADAYARRSAGHNVWLVDGHGQAPGPRRCEDPVPGQRLQAGDRWDYARSAWTDFGGLPGSICHARAVCYLHPTARHPGLWIVVDRLCSDRERAYQALWHWHPRCTVTIDGDACRSTDDDRGNLAIAPLTWPGTVELVCGQADPLQGWYSPRYNVFEPCPTSVYRAVARDLTTVWVLTTARGAVAPARATVLAEDAEAVTLEITAPTVGRVVVPLGDGATVSLAD